MTERREMTETALADLTTEDEEPWEPETYPTAQTLPDGRGINVQVAYEPSFPFGGCVRLTIADDLYGREVFNAFLRPGQARPIAIALIQAAVTED